MKKKITKPQEGYRNLYIMKLLVTAQEFKDDIAKIRSDFSIPLSGFSSSKESQEWHDNLARSSDDFWGSQQYKDLVKKVIGFKKSKNYPEANKLQDYINSAVPLNKFYDTIDVLMDKYNLRYNFLNAVTMYIHYDKIMHIPLYNFSLSFLPDKNRKTRSIEIRTYSKLSEQEIREAAKQLKQMQEWRFSPMLNIDVRKHKDIDTVFQIEEEMKKRKMKKVEVLEHYLQLAKKNSSPSQYRLARKENKGMISYEPKYTSKHIARKYLKDKTKGDAIRQINSRLKKERKKLFGI